MAESEAVSPGGVSSRTVLPPALGACRLPVCFGQEGLLPRMQYVFLHLAAGMMRSGIGVPVKESVRCGYLDREGCQIPVKHHARSGKFQWLKWIVRMRYLL